MVTDIWKFYVSFAIFFTYFFCYNNNIFVRHRISNQERVGIFCLKETIFSYLLVT